MSVNEPQSSTTPPRPPRAIKLKYAAWIAGILVVAILGVWGWKSVECAAISRGRDEALRAASERSAATIAKCIALFAHRDIVARNYRDLQEYADDLVRSKPIAYIAITDLRSRGRAVVHTNREFLGKPLSSPGGSSEVAEASVAVMEPTRQVGTVQVGVRLR